MLDSKLNLTTKDWDMLVSSLCMLTELMEDKLHRSPGEFTKQQIEFLDDLPAFTAMVEKLEAYDESRKMDENLNSLLNDLNDNNDVGITIAI